VPGARSRRRRCTPRFDGPRHFEAALETDAAMLIT
jgi:hypothetical protein